MDADLFSGTMQGASLPETVEVTWREIRRACDAVAGTEDRAGPLLQVAGVLCVVSGAMWPGGTDGPVEGFAWAVMPREAWSGPTYCYRELVAMWDGGERRRGDCAGQVLRSGNRQLVKAAPIRLVAFDYRAGNAAAGAGARRSPVVQVPTGEQLPMF